MTRMLPGLLFGAWLLAWAPVAATGNTEVGEAPAILLLTSYHQGDRWNDNIVKGFLKALPPGKARVFIEYLDSQRLSGETYLPQLLALLARKYAQVPIRLLAGTDDAALDFWLAHGASLFPGRPVVFCGLNDFTPSRLAGRADVTGVCEAPDVLGTLELALTLLPRVRTIVALGADVDATSRDNLARFRRAMLALGRRTRAVELLNLTLPQARQALAALTRDTAVLRLGALLSESGRRLPREQVMDSLAASSPVPIFVLWDFDLHDGAMGGRVISAASQGIAAAKLAVRVLDGQPPASLPVTDAPNRTILDYQALHRFGISAASLPAGIAIINEPVSTYARYKILIWSAGVALTLLVPTAILLFVTLAGRQTAEKRLRESEARYRELVESAHSLILRFDRTGRLVFVNEYAEQLLGYTKEELPKVLATPPPAGPADLSGLLARAMMAPQVLGEQVAEHEIATRDGRRVIVHWDKRMLRDAGGDCTGWLAVGTDITARRLAEDALAARMLAEEELLGLGRELLANGPGALERGLRRLLTAFAADRVALLQNVLDATLGLCGQITVEVTALGVEPPPPGPDGPRMPYNLDAFRWADTLESGETIAGLARDFPESLQALFRPFHIQALMAAPVTVNGKWCGFLAVSDTRTPRRFTRQEQTQLATAASILSAHLSRPDTA